MRARACVRACVCVCVCVFEVTIPKYVCSDVSVVVDSFTCNCLSYFVCLVSCFCYAVLFVLSCFAIISLRKRELVALLYCLLAVI